MDEENGVTVGFKEIYDEMKGVSESLIKLDHRIQSIEEKIETVNEANERSRQAEHLAEKNQKEIEELKKDFYKYVQAERQSRDNNRKNMIATAAIAVPVLLAIIPILVQYYTP